MRVWVALTLAAVSAAAHPYQDQPRSLSYAWLDEYPVTDVCCDPHHLAIVDDVVFLGYGDFYGDVWAIDVADPAFPAVLSHTAFEGYTFTTAVDDGQPLGIVYADDELIAIRPDGSAASSVPAPGLVDGDGRDGLLHFVTSSTYQIWSSPTFGFAEIGLPWAAEKVTGADGNQAFILAAGDRVLVVDWLASPPAVTTTISNVPGDDIVAGEGLVYCVGDPSGTYVIDAMASPPSVASVLPSAETVVSLDGYVVVGTRIYDLSNPASPVQIGEVNDGGDAAVGQGTVRFHPERFRLVATELGDGTSVLPIGEVEVGGAWTVSRVGDLVGVAGVDQFRLVDISNPAAPQLQGSLITNGRSLATMVGSTAYVVEEDSRLRVVDVTDPLTPIDIGDVALPSGIAFANALATFDDHVYVPVGTGVQVVDAGNPAAPVVVGSFGAPSTSWVQVVDDRLYTEDGIYDLSTPESPQYVGGVPSGTGRFGAAVDRLHVVDASSEGGHTWGYSYDYRMMSYDVTDPASPVTLSTFFVPGDYALQELREVNGLLFAQSHHGLFVVDVRDPAQPELLASLAPEYTTIHAAEDLVTVASGGWLYVYPGVPAPVSVPSVVSPRPHLVVAPNPFAGSVRIDIRVDVGQPIRVDVFDAGGRRVASEAHVLAPGRNEIVWDGHDRLGTQVPPGVYFVRLAGDWGAQTTRIVRAGGR